jgi:hypothetical protein
LGRIIVASLAMGLVLIGLQWVLTIPASSILRAFRLAALVVAGLATYAAALQVLGVVQVRVLIAAVRERG